MGKPKIQDISESLGVSSNQVNMLKKRGMPTDSIKKARDWFEKNGFSLTPHSKSGGAAHTPINPSISGTRSAKF